MSYEFLSNDELKHELELTARQFQRTKQQLERLIAMKSEGKVTNDVFREVFDDISNKFEAYSPKYNELKKVCQERAEKEKEEMKKLRRDLEGLEVRYAIGSVPEDQYKVNRATYLMRLQEIEEFTRTIESLLVNINEDMERSLSMVGQYRQAPTKEERVLRVPVTEISEARPTVERTSKAKSPPTEVKKEPKIKICPRCGAENPETSLYCYNCGAKLT